MTETMANKLQKSSWRDMWKNSGIILILGLLLAVTSCKSAYDKLLTSTDNKMKLAKAFEYYQEQEYYKAQMLFEQVMPFYRATPQIDTIYYHYAYTHYNLDNFILASYYFKNFTQTFSTSAFNEEAFYMIPFSNYQMSPTYKLDQTYTLKAIEGFQQFVNRYPTSGKVPTCNALIDEMRVKLEKKAVASAELYYKLSNYQSADHSYRNLLKDYPDSKDAEKIRYRIVQASYKLAENTVEVKQIERYNEVIENCKAFTKRHPESQYTNSVTSILKNATAKVNSLSKNLLQLGKNKK